VLFGVKEGVAVTRNDIDTIREVRPPVDCYERRRGAYKMLEKKGWYRLGLAYEAKGDLRKAEEAYGHAAQLADQQDVKEPSVYNTLGYLLLRQGRAADSAPCFEKALKIDPSHPEAQRNLEAARRPVERSNSAVARASEGSEARARAGPGCKQAGCYGRSPEDSP